MQGTIATMATPLLADAHGQNTPHLIQHDLESFFWTTLFGLVNLTGPFQEVKDWSKVVPGSTKSGDQFKTTMIPPVWMQPGVAVYSFNDVHESRLSTLGNWGYYRSFIQPYWQDEVILSGMEKMFNIFMSQDMLNVQQEECNVVTDLSCNRGLRHDKLITIVKEIIQGIKGTNDMLYMLGKGIPVNNLVQNGRDRYESVLRYNQLPPAVPSDDDLKNKPVVPTIPTISTFSHVPPKCRPTIDLPSLVDGSAGSTPPFLQDGQWSYSASHGSAQLHSAANSDKKIWQGMGEKTFMKMSGFKFIKPTGMFQPAVPNTMHYHTFPVSQYQHHAVIAPAMDVATPGGVSRSPSKRSADECSAEDEDEATFPARKHCKGKEKAGSCMGESDGHYGTDNLSAHAPSRGRPSQPKAGH